MKTDNYYKHAGFALVAAALTLSAGAAKASDQESWVWEDQGNRRVAVVMPAPDVVYRSAPQRIVYSRPALRRVVYTRPAVRRVVYSRPAVRKVVYSRPAVRRVVYRRPTLFPSSKVVRWYADRRADYIPVSGTYLSNVGYLQYR